MQKPLRSDVGNQHVCGIVFVHSLDLVLELLLEAFVGAKTRPTRKTKVEKPYDTLAMATKSRVSILKFHKKT